MKAALYNTEIPRVVAATLDGGEPDIQLSDDLYDCIKLDVINYPMVITVCKVSILSALCCYFNVSMSVCICNYHIFVISPTDRG